MSHYKQVPYGVADFDRVIKQNFYYVDKTMYLPLLEEQPSNLFFIRPRRFGKSLFLNMLRAYYDCEKKEEFQTLFGKCSKAMGRSGSSNQRLCSSSPR